ncbi:putative FAD-dependent oxygenase [Xylaria nigripes]|nr:putative FAD-dependent oxygenase [Xylaria nigripes]
MRPFGVAILLAGGLSAVLCSNLTAYCGSPVDFLRGLRGSLSAGAAGYLPGTDDFNNATKRWSDLETPKPDLVIVAATEDDVVKTVNQALECGLPILAFNGVHGAITTLGKMDKGVAISLSKLSSVVVSHDGKSATIGGGALSKAVTDALWASGKQTVTGTCECVGYLGPALGGGHGWLQGHHGLVADQLISMNVVMADGVLHRIDSSSDLWWALKGAGQNFGIVTSVTTKVYDIEYSDWAIETMIFKGNDVEAVYEAANQHFSNAPAHVINWSYWLNMLELDTEKPVILFYIIQEGVTVVDPAYTSPFRAIGPVSSEAMSGTYQDLAAWTGISLDSPPCQKAGLANPRFPIYLQEYDVAAQREAYDMFAANVGGANSPYNASIFMFEAYPQQGVRAIGGNSTAFAFRDDSLLVSPLLTYAPAGEKFNYQTRQIGNQLREILYRGSGRDELHVYVNYANGDEEPQNWFGYEQWRQDRLKELKEKYDPEGRFSFYAPIE